MSFDIIIGIIFLFLILSFFSPRSKKAAAVSNQGPVAIPGPATVPSTQVDGQVYSMPSPAPAAAPAPLQPQVAYISIANYYALYDTTNTPVQTTLWFNTCNSLGVKRSPTSDVYFTKSECNFFNSTWTASSPQIVDINGNTLGVCIDTSSGISLSASCSKNMTVPA
jgi:hypothetical protein